MRTQPWLTALPMSHGSLVPWMRHLPAVRPVVQLGLEGAGAEREHAVGAAGSGGRSFWVMKKCPVGVARPGLPTATG